MRRTALRILAVVCVMSMIVGCSKTAETENNEKYMTKEEVQSLIDSNNATIKAEMKKSVSESIEESLSKIEISESDKRGLEESILAKVDIKINQMSNSKESVNYYNTYKSYTTKEEINNTTENTTVVQTDAPPRIEDGTVVPIKTTFPINGVSSQGVEYTINSGHAEAYNFAEDTPYAGHDYAYTIKMVLNITFKEHSSDVSVDIPEKMYMFPYDFLFADGEMLSDISRPGPTTPESTRDYNFNTMTNMIPEYIYIK